MDSWHSRLCLSAYCVQQHVENVYFLDKCLSATKACPKHASTTSQTPLYMQEQLQPFIDAGCYFVIDCPGQAELFMCHDSFKRVVKSITSEWHINLTAVQLVDSHLCTAPHTYLSALLMCLSSMLQLELPHVNVISKVRHRLSLASFRNQ